MIPLWCLWEFGFGRPRGELGFGHTVARNLAAVLLVPSVVEMGNWEEQCRLSAVSVSRCSGP